MAEFDGNGVRALYANNGNFITFGPLTERGGTRADLSNPPINCEYTGFFSGGGSDDNAAKLRGGNHSDGENCNGCCYILNCPSNGGSPGCRTECPHPDYGGCTGMQNSGSCPSFSGFNGMKAVVWNTTNNCVHLELWVDSTGTAPGNWTKVMQGEDCNGMGQLSNCGGGPLLRPRGGDQFTWRCDGGPDSKWMVAVEISPGGAANPGTGGAPGGTPPSGTPGGAPGGNPNGGMGDGGGGAGNDNNTGTGAFAFAQGGCAIAKAGNTVAQAGRCTNTGGTGEDLIPGVGSGDAVGGATEPKPIVTVYKDLAILYNIRTDKFDNCSVTGDPNVQNYTEVYSVNPVQGEYKSIFQNGLQYIGLKLHASSSALIKKKIRKVDVTMKRSTAVALTGDLKMEIRNRNGTLLEEFDTVLDPATIDLNDATYSFLHNGNAYELQAGDMILLSYTNGGNATDHILVASTATGADSFDGMNTNYVESFDGISYDIDQLADAAFKVYT